VREERTPNHPTVVVDDDLLACWYIQLTTEQDFFGGVSREPDGSFKVSYRFRYYRDDKVHDSSDEKSCTEMTSTDADTLKKVRGIVQLMRAKSGGRMFEVLREQRTTEQMLEEISAWPVVHRRPEVKR
jgi:hypothetical protein